MRCPLPCVQGNDAPQASALQVSHPTHSETAWRSVPFHPCFLCLCDTPMQSCDWETLCLGECTHHMPSTLHVRSLQSASALTSDCARHYRVCTHRTSHVPVLHLPCLTSVRVCFDCARRLGLHALLIMQVDMYVGSGGSSNVTLSGVVATNNTGTDVSTLCIHTMFV